MTPPLNKIICGDSIELMKEINSDSIHLILSDIPYGIGIDEWDVLHDNKNTAYLGSSPAQEKAGAVFKKRGKPLNGWSEADRLIPIRYYEWCMRWATEWYRTLKPGASVFIFAGRRLVHRCICAMEDVGFTYKDMIAWDKIKAPHRAQRVSIVFERRGDKLSAKKWEGWRIGNLRPRFEPILWFTKPYKIGSTVASNLVENQVGAFNEKGLLHFIASPDNILSVPADSHDIGLHPTQKPLKLMQLLIEMTTTQGQIVLDPFCGSGTTLIAALKMKRHYIGYELNPDYFKIASDRINKELNHQELDLFNSNNH
ncbi:site-specific DNA-methyltransferase [Thioflexithrix psekupsensis]|uniref:Methyltransferase n=2 Tax=Thioflexithrix psekupsensis TaxID=1570016 RepID=A0A251XC95_9GAMM|nr:site-specific DNA-methyltransferase [Thioflexithrix psekupsensis]